MQGASTVGSKGVEVSAACVGTVATTLGFLAALTHQMAAGGADGLLLLLGASTVGSEGGVGTTAGGGGA